MKQHTINYKTILITVIVINILLVAVYLFLNGDIRKNQVWDITKNYGFFTLIIVGIWIYFNKWGWRKLPYNLRHYFNFPPDLRGRWEGIIKYDEQSDYPFVIEIRQTMLTIELTTYSRKDGKSVSILSAFAVNNSGNQFHISYYWSGNSGDDKNANEFKGFTILQYIPNKKNEDKKLKGEYFTNRNPKQTKGTIELKWVSHELKQQF